MEKPQYILLKFSSNQKDMLEKIDELRGLVPRATFIKKEVIEKYLLNNVE